MNTDSLTSKQEWPWRDVMVVAAATVISVMISVHLELYARLYLFSRQWEHFQLDEFPIGLLVLSMSLIWLAWRRFRHARRELFARRIAERQLAAALGENRRLAQEHLRIQESERKHLARELHDHLGQYLNAIKLDALSINDGAGDFDASAAARASAAIVRNVDHVHGAVSDMIGRLRPVGLDELGLVAAIEHCVDSWRQRLSDTTFLLSVCGDFENLSEELTLTLYRLIQEGLTNIYKHADAARVEIALERRTAEEAGGELKLTVMDDGRGMNSNIRTSRFGLSGMRERVEMTGGRFVLRSSPGEGLRFEAYFPFDAGGKGVR